MIKTEKDSVEQNSAGLTRPLRVSVFRNLLIADLVSNTGTFMQSVGAAVVDGFTTLGPGLRRPYPNCGFPSLLSTRITCWLRLRYLRSPQTHSIYRSLDDGGPELVSKDDLAPASALNGIEFNLARAVEPATAGMLIAVLGVSTAFVANVISFCGVILVVAT